VKSWFKHAQPLVLAAALGAVFGACDEKLDTGLACPALCPHQQVSVRDTTFFAVEFDTSIAGFPPQGSEIEFFIAAMGDTLQSMAIVRYDSLPKHFRYAAAAEDSLIYATDSAEIKLFLVTGDTLGPPTRIEIYDVDLGGPDDTDPDAVQSAFTPDRLIGTRTVPADSMRDTTVIPIDAGRLLTKIQSDSPSNRLRIGIKVNPAGGGATHFLMQSAENLGAEPRLRFRPHFDPAVAKLEVEPKSFTPANPFVRATMQDYLITPVRPPDPPADALRVGGLPGRRTYMRFAVPAQLLDSTNIIRATLLLTQRPNPAAPQPDDSLAVQVLRVAAAPTVTDLSRALLFVQRFRDADTLRLVASGDGIREFEVVNLVRSWAGTTADKTPRALALARPIQAEGRLPRLIDFYSNEASPALRPRLRIWYLPKAGGGLP
jgi:hypothetical protein